MASYSMQAKARALLELRKRQAVAQSVQNAGGDCPIGPDTTFLEWCEDLGAKGLKVDGMPFRLDNRPALRQIYEAIPASKAEGYNKIFAIIKGAQTGATVMTFLMQLYLCLKYMPLKVGTYYPDMKLAAYVSSSRFLPVVRSVPAAHAALRQANNGGEGNVMTRTLGSSEVLFLYTSGSSITESFPLGAIVADEVQNMNDSDISRIRERMSASDVRFFFACSTANGIGTDIDALYQKGNQHRFHTQCGCDDGVILDEVFPECIENNTGQLDDAGAPRGWVYVCPTCRSYIPDTQQGRWVQHNPGSENISYHLPQTLSPTVSAKEVMDEYLGSPDLTSFYQRKLGKPYNNPSQVPITMDILNKAAELGKRLGVQWKTSGRDTFMGLDQMGGFIVAIILERLPTGHQAVIHAEFIYGEGDETWDRSAELMKEYHVQTCVVEQLPNVDSARKFANKFRGRVYLATYGGSQGDMIVWADQTDRSEKRTIQEDRSRYMVGLDQYKAMQAAMKRIVHGVTAFADPNGLVAEVKTRGVREPKAVLRECWKHFMKVALVVEHDKEQRRPRAFVKKIGTDDPHASYAFMLANVAWARAWGTGVLIMPGPDKVAEVAPPIQALVDQHGAKHLPGHVAKALIEAAAVHPPSATCASCRFFNSGISYCGQRGFGTASIEPACDEFERKEED
jgi:hypothetical protein